jgi:hypothetical protein
VDWHDQLMALFYLKKRHGFKKWHVKIWLTLVNIDLTDVSICYSLANPELKKKEGHHRRFFEAIAIFLKQHGETYDWCDSLAVKIMMLAFTSRSTILMNKGLVMATWTVSCCVT